MNFNQFINKQDIEMTQDEQNVFQFLQQYDEQWASIFQDKLLTGRDKVTKRLVTSIHRENLVHGNDHSQLLNRRKFAGYDTHVTDILEIHFPKSKLYLYAPVTGQHAFNRIDVEGPFYYKREQYQDEFKRILHPNDILDWILTESPELDNEASQQFRDDQTNSAANMTFALSYQYFKMKDDRAPLYDIIKNHQDSYLRSEQAVVEGHPLHPGAKLRKGMDAFETFRYSSEFTQPIELKIVLLHHSVARVQALDANYNDTMKHMFPDIYSHLEKEFSGQVNLDDYQLMIMHPWQYDHVLHQDYMEELDQRLMIVSEYSIPYYAGLSFRTLVPELPNKAPHIKLSTNVHITGEIRTLSEQTTHNGPLVTHILNDILTKDSTFKQYASTVIDEVAGIHFYNSNDSDEIQTDRSEQLGTLFRNNFYHSITNDVIPVIPSSLVATYPYNSETPIQTLIQTYQISKGFQSFEEAAKTWMNEYSKALLGLVIPLYSKYGIALEAHLQNSVATFNEDGSLNKLYIRDFEGLRIDTERLNQSGYETNHFHEKSRILTNSKTSVFNKAFYSTVQNHLGELVLTIAKSSHSSSLENEIWKDMALILKDILSNITELSEGRRSEIEEVIFAPTIDYKCVTTMRLEDQAHEYTYIKVNNPLH
ncbi:IucA/IucC family protein [Staphylococcus capitis]|uniref:IucA/IucC family protein n=1 Tax=Staphylococcus capitis TaxID=29388 RepID=UPI00064B754C|nr:IucA/IucC family protein [Staphylococcus capitis]AKL92465.1 Aerobactin synthase [Staphylococcus capitis subsp. capitis]MCC0830285.1 sialic acid synthase [Staphylococcus capitis]MCC3744102.1 sialic acid synthase [Staphylococcus capitis]MCC9115713.1 sialic acid synthase [Staphylococcus capitis]MCC9141964.1 sialic acid synthase [Staphylococcus capitis]